MRIGQQRFDGTWLYVDKEYDEYGRLERESMPFKGSAATKWTGYLYDSYDRLTKVSEASGKEMRLSYSGNSVSTTEKGISTVRTKDASGQLVKVSDPSGEVSYHYHADGQLQRIVAPENAVERECNSMSRKQWGILLLRLRNDCGKRLASLYVQSGRELLPQYGLSLLVVRTTCMHGHV